MTLDMTWKEPSPEQAAALDLAIKFFKAHRIRGLFHGMTEFALAEFICLSKHSFWYVQAKDWAEKCPEWAPPTFQLGSQVVVQIVDSGYSNNDGWWPMQKLFPDKSSQVGAVLALMDFGTMIKQMRGRSLMVVSAGFDVFIDFICGPRWEKRFKKVMSIAEGK